MTANTSTPHDRNSRNDTSDTNHNRSHTGNGNATSDTTTQGSTNDGKDTSDNGDRDGDNNGGEELEDLTPKQQAIIIAALEHPDDPAVTIATRVRTAQSYPSQVITKYSYILNKLRCALSSGNSVVDVIEHELDKPAITALVERGLLDGVDTEFTEIHRSDDTETSIPRQNANNEQDVPTDRPVTVQRSFMSAAPDDESQRSHSDVGDELNDLLTHEITSTQTTPTDVPMTIETDPHSPDDEGGTDISGHHRSDEVVQEWYNALTEKQRAIVDAITQHPDATDTRRAEIASNQLANGESVSRAYVSKTKADDATFLEALRSLREQQYQSDKPRNPTSDESRSQSAVENATNGGTNMDPNYDPNSIANGQDVITTGEAGTTDEAQEKKSNIPVDDLKRVRDRIAFSANVIEREYHFIRTTTNRDDDFSGQSGTNMAEAVVFARQTLAEIDKLLDHST
jgi:hypothetical protein